MSKETSGISTAGMVIGICALVFCWLPLFNWVLAILATIFGAISVKNKKKFGWAGLVMGMIAIVISIIIPSILVTMATLSLSTI